MNGNFFDISATYLLRSALLAAVKTIVSAIKNSVRLVFKLMILKLLNIKVVQCPIVNAVIKMTIFL